MRCSGRSRPSTGSHPLSSRTTCAGRSTMATPGAGSSSTPPCSTCWIPSPRSPSATSARWPVSPAPRPSSSASSRWSPSPSCMLHTPTTSLRKDSRCARQDLAQLSEEREVSAHLQPADHIDAAYDAESGSRGTLSRQRVEIERPQGSGAPRSQVAGTRPSPQAADLAGSPPDVESRKGCHTRHAGTGASSPRMSSPPGPSAAAVRCEPASFQRSAEEDGSRNGPP